MPQFFQNLWENVDIYSTEQNATKICMQCIQLYILDVYGLIRGADNLLFSKILVIIESQILLNGILKKIL